MLRWHQAAAAAGLVCLATACGDDGHDHEGNPDPAMLACDEVGEAGTAITAGTARDDTAPAIELGGEPYTITLPDGAPGYVRLVTDEPEELAILLFDQEDVLANIWQGTDGMLEFTSAGPDSFCPDEIPEHFDVDFETQGTYYLELGPVASGQVWMIASGAEGHGEGHDHE